MFRHTFKITVFHDRAADISKLGIDEILGGHFNEHYAFVGDALIESVEATPAEVARAEAIGFHEREFEIRERLSFEGRVKNTTSDICVNVYDPEEPLDLDAEFAATDLLAAYLQGYCDGEVVFELAASETDKTGDQ